MKRTFRSKKGVALMLVLAALVLMTTMGVEFAYNTNVNYHLALSERDRLQSYYLAKSAYNFMLLELKFDRVFRQVVQSQNLGQYLGVNAQLPLCQQFPLSTGLIRAVFTGGGLEGLLGAEGEEGGEEIEDLRRDVTISEERGAEEFLKFEGDFDGECIDENTKINLNGFWGLRSTPGAEGEMSQVDQYKQFLFRFMSRPEFELLFEKADVRVTDAITNIGDWVDTNAEINEFGGRGGGFEKSLYDRAEAQYQIRNGKLMTLMEAFLIDGVADDWFAPMMDYFTIYGDAKINVCTTRPDVVESLIRRYVDTTPGLPPLRLEDPEEMARLTTAVAEACASGAVGGQLAQAVDQALNTAIGTISEEWAEIQPAAAGAEQGFGAFVSTDPRFFTLKVAGQTLDNTVRIKAVVDVKEADPKRWDLLYWRVY
jgi:type II secretory pathway component PulK